MENQTAGTCHLGSTEGGQETAGGDGGRGRGKTAEQGFPPPPQIMEEDVGWYRVAVDHTLPPARITLERITAERVELYCNIPPPPPRERISPHLYHPPKMTIPYLKRRRSSGRCRDYGGIGREVPPRCMPSITGVYTRELGAGSSGGSGGRGSDVGVMGGLERNQGQ